MTRLNGVEKVFQFPSKPEIDMMKLTKPVTEKGENTMCKQFICHLIANLKIFEHRVNCDNMISAIHICEGLFPKARVVEVTEVLA